MQCICRNWESQGSPGGTQAGRRGSCPQGGDRFVSQSLPSAGNVCPGGGSRYGCAHVTTFHARRGHRPAARRRRHRQPRWRRDAETISVHRRPAGHPPCGRPPHARGGPDPAGRRRRADHGGAGGAGASARGARRRHPPGQRARRPGGAGPARARRGAGARRRPPLRAAGHGRGAAGGAGTGAGRHPGGAGGRHAQARRAGRADHRDGVARRALPGADSPGFPLPATAGAASCGPGGRHRRCRHSGSRRPRGRAGGGRRAEHQADLQGGPGAAGTRAHGHPDPPRWHRL